MQTHYHIVIKDGAFKGASVTDGAGRLIPFDPDALTAVVPEINAAALAEIEAMKVRHAEELAIAKGQPRASKGSVTKLTIMRRLGPKWKTLKNILTSMPEDVQDAWTLAQEIRQDDELFAQHAPALKAMLELTDEEFDSLFVP